MQDRRELMRAGMALAATALGSRVGRAATWEPEPSAPKPRGFYVEIECAFGTTTVFDGVSEIGGSAFQ